jgi:hypothetical protein
MNIEIEIETTEYYVHPDEDNKKTVFCIQDKAVVISFTNGYDEVITQSEIPREEALKLASIISHFYSIR